ncbi:MAG: 2-hydroxyacyl-CoA dehydratase [candidate division WOR-3 bacterium]|nr:MAG: 2-hydroxyacyl-CoA dehydratase [candidate division WOR-3 bacterium]
MALIPDERFEELRADRISELARLRQDGTRVVGYFSFYTPVEVIKACGAEPVRLNRGGFEAETSGTRHLRSDACPYCLSSMGNLELDPLYRLVDAVVSVNTCDMLRRLPETIHRQSGLPVYQVYMPRTSEPLPHRVAEFRRNIEWLAGEMETFTGTKFEEEKAVLETGRLNRVRQRLRSIDQTRKQDDPKLTESDVLNLVALATLLGEAGTDNVLSEVEHAVSADHGLAARPHLTGIGHPHPIPPAPGRGNEREGVSVPSAIHSTPGQASVRRYRLALAGSEMAELDRWLVHLLESKASVVTDLLDTGTRWFEDDIELAGGVFEDLARFYYSRSPCITRRPNLAAYVLAGKKLDEYRVQGLVYKTLLYCDPWDFEAVRLRQELEIPMLHVDGNYSAENREQLRTRVEAFLESL